MNKNQIDYSIYLCTDRDLMSSATIEESVELALKGGATVVQIREKDCTTKDFFELAKRVKSLTDKFGVPLIINDRVDIAMAVGASGVHVGQSDMPCDEVKKLVGKDMIVGVSAGNVEQARKAVEQGADYLGVGAMFSTSTKTDAKITSFDELKEIRKKVDVPIVVIGGINHKTAPQFKAFGIDGLALVSAIVSADDVEKSTKELMEIWKN